MIVTEEEAKTKRCQEGFGPPLPTPTVCMSPPSAGGFYSHGPVGSTYAYAPPIINCIGSACMAWRWAQWEDSGEYGRPRGNPIAGYCGKAGRP